MRLDVSPICSSPGAIPSAIHAAADACNHHHGNCRGMSAGGGYVGRRLADHQLGGSGLDQKKAREIFCGPSNIADDNIDSYKLFKKQVQIELRVHPK